MIGIIGSLNWKRTEEYYSSGEWRGKKSMNAFFEALESVLSIFVLIVIGYLLQKKGKITDKIGSFISFFVVNITLPCSYGNCFYTYQFVDYTVCKSFDYIVYDGKEEKI